MPYDIQPTTAEDIIGATDAALQCVQGVDKELVAEFLDCPIVNAGNALLMAEQLGLVRSDIKTFSQVNPFATYLVASSLTQKAAILRLILEQYEPYRFFKARLQISESVVTAANEVKAIYSMTAHRADILSTLVSLGTYTNSLTGEGAGRYKVSDGTSVDYFKALNDVVHQRATTEVFIRKRIGEAAVWIDQQEVLDHLITAYQRLSDIENDSRAPIVHAGNAIESFLVQVAKYYGVDISGATGINAKVDRIAQANKMTTKHKFILKYIGHVRNAADHGIDADIGQTWEISKYTAIELVHVSLSVITNVVAKIAQDKYIV